MFTLKFRHVYRQGLEKKIGNDMAMPCRTESFVIFGEGMPALFLEVISSFRGRFEDSLINLNPDITLTKPCNQEKEKPNRPQTYPSLIIKIL